MHIKEKQHKQVGFLTYAFIHIHIVLGVWEKAIEKSYHYYLFVHKHF